MSGLIGTYGAKSSVTGVPQGCIVQTVSKLVNTKANVGHSSSGSTFTEVHTDFRITITPRFQSSRIEILFSVPFNQNSASNILTLFRVFRLITGGSKAYDIDSYGGSASTRHRLAGMSYRPVGYDAQDSDLWNQNFVDRPDTYKATVYGFETKPQGTNTTRFNESYNANADWGWSAQTLMTATEIRE